MDLRNRWSRFWMRRAGLGPMGRLAMRWAALPMPPHKGRVRLAAMSPFGYVAPKAVIHHRALHLGAQVFIDDGVVIYERRAGGAVRFGEKVRIYRETIIETGYGGSVTVGDGCSIHPRCQINGYVEEIVIGRDVMIAPNCAIYSYDHGIERGRRIAEQPLTSKGPIVIGDGSWVGFGTIVLSGVRVGEDAAIGAGSVVTKDVPAGVVVAGNPARIIKRR